MGYSQILHDAEVRNVFTCINPHHGGVPFGKLLVPFYWKTPKGGKLLVWSGLTYDKANILGLIPGVMPGGNPGIPGMLPDNSGPVKVTGCDSYASRRLFDFVNALKNRFSGKSLCYNDRRCRRKTGRNVRACGRRAACSEKIAEGGIKMTETERVIYAGSYADAEEPGIHAFRIFRNEEDTAIRIEEIFQTAGASNPSYLAVSKDGALVYAVQEDMTYDGKEGGGIAAFKRLGNSLTLLNTMGTRGTLPCHLLLDEKRGFLYTANYMSGSVSMFRLGEDGSIKDMCDFKQHSGHGPNPERQEGPHVHFIGHSSDEKGIWCVDLGLDTVRYYGIDEKNAKLIPNEERDIHLPAGTGPRHFVLDRSRKEYMYVVCELSSEVYVVNCSGEKPQIIQGISTLDGCKDESTCAAIHLSEDGKFLYASNRGDDSIAVFSAEENHQLRRVEVTKTEGRNPRDFWVGDGILLAANQDSDSITVFWADQSTGRITRTGETIPCRKPVCLVSRN